MSKKINKKGSLIYLYTHTTKLTTLRSKHSQSALEYMMTYGWAILIIVIVAAGLYSLGIFSPTNSAGTTVTGFSSLGSVQAACSGNQGLLITLGNSAGAQMNITKINISSDSGYSNTLNTNILLTPNQENTIFLSSTSLCSSGSSYSLKVSVTYTEPGQTFQGPYFSSGTVQGTPSNSISFSVQNMVVLGLSHKEQLNITNSQSSATPAPFQQMINLSAANFTSYGAPNLQNVIFYYPNGQVIPSWLESNGSKSSVSSIFWLKLSEGLAANQKQTIYMGFAPSTSNLFNTNNIGEAPQLSAAYGQYNDGANVFNFYDEFSGPTLNPQWVNNGENAPSFSSGLNLSGGITSSTGSYSIASLTLSTNYAGKNYISESYLKLYSDADIYDQFGLYILNSSSSTAYSVAYSILADADFSTNLNQVLYGQVQNPQNTITGLSGAVSWATNKFFILGMQVSGANFLDTVNYSTIIPTHTDYGSSTQYPALGAWRYSIIHVYWYRIRAYPPNGVMPSVSFGSIQ